MNIRSKLLLGAGALALVPVLLTGGLVGEGAYSTARDSLTQEVQSKLVSLRENKKAQVENYMATLVEEVRGLARTRLAIDGMKGFKQTYTSIAQENDPSGKSVDANLAKYRAEISQYYAGDFTKEFERRNAAKVPDMQGIAGRLDATAVAMQYFYIAANPNPLGKKDQLMISPDASAYSRLHAQLHPSLEALQKKLGYYDIFLIDTETNRVLYTVFKELDFASVLSTGISAKTRLEEAYNRVAQATSPDEFALSDYSEYLASYNDQAAFIAVPVFDGSVRVGVLAVQVPLDKITTVMSSSGKWKEEGLGATGESYLVGPDKFMRTDSRFLLEESAKFAETFATMATAEQTATLKKKNTTIGLLKIDTAGVRNALGGNTGVEQYKDYRGQEVVGDFVPFKLHVLNWALVAEQDASEVFAPVKELGQTTVIRGALVGILVLTVAGVAIFWFLRNFLRPIDKLQATVGRVAEGDMSARAEIKTGDEIENLGNALDNLLNDRIAALAKAERENEQLNNSVISLMQTVFQLSQKDLTAKAAVTEDVIGTLADSINQLSGETGKVLNEVTQIAAKVERATQKVKSQAHVVSETAQTEREGVEKMTQNLATATEAMNRVAQLAESSNKAAEQATQSTDTALSTVDSTVKGMNTIRQTISETEKRIKRLGERSQEISSIVNLINTISERTHVLALNAAMQAAIAGDAGRGFAVVAEEVQRLAESSRNATSQIAQLVNNIQLETNETIATVNRTISQVVDGSELAQKAGEQMRATQQMTANLVDLVKRIASGSQVQVKMAEELRRRVSEIGESTSATAGQIDAQTTESETLVEFAKQLVHSVRVFRLPEDARPGSEDSSTQTMRTA